MTTQRIQRLRQKIQESRGRLMTSQPFFAMLLMYVKFIAVPEMKKISTNGRCIYFSPDFLDKLYCHELDYILCHQIMHIVCGNIWRPFDMAGDNYHLACDIKVNALLSDCGFHETRYAHLGEIYRSAPGSKYYGKDHTVEEIYYSLPFSLYAFDDKTRNRFLPDNDAWWDNKSDNGGFGILILDTPKEEGYLIFKVPGIGDDEEANENKKFGMSGASAAMGDDLQQLWQGRAAASAKSIANINDDPAGGKGNGAGNIPGFMLREISEEKKPVVDWRQLLQAFVQEEVCDYSFSPPDRRYEDTGFFLPDFNDTDFVVQKILFMADTSASIDESDLGAVYSEICGAIEQFDGKLEGELGFFDIEVTPPIPFVGADELKQILPYGGGGTDFGPVFSFVTEHYRNELPACIVIFTDGDGPYPNEEDIPDVPVLWIINNTYFTPPFGAVARFLSDKVDDFD